jgi:hypothetical protein
LAQQFQRRPLKQHTFSNIWAFCFFCVLFINKKNHSLPKWKKEAQRCQ